MQKVSQIAIQSNPTQSAFRDAVKPAASPAKAKRKPVWPQQDEAEAKLAEESQALIESPLADTLPTKGEIVGVYAQADTTTVTDAGAGPGPGTANTAVAATGLSAGNWGLIGAAGLGLAAAVGGGSNSTPQNTPKVNEAPTALALTGALAGVGKNEVAENTAITTRLKVADIAVTDDGLGTNTLSLSGADKDLFEIDGLVLYLKAGTALNHEAKPSYAVTVQVQDSTVSNSAALRQNFSFQVTDVNEAPTALALTGALAGVGKNEVAENTAISTRLKVADIAITDDGLGTNTLSLSGADKDLFEIDGHVLYLKAGIELDYEAKPSYAVTVQVQDSTVSNSAALRQNFRLQVTDVYEAPIEVNEAPTALALTGALAGVGKNEVAENTAISTRLKVADIAVTDDGLGTNTLSLSGADKDLFEIDGHVLYLKAGTALDYEAKPSYAVTVQVQDSTVSNSTALSQSFELKLTDVAAPTSAQAFALWQEAELAWEDHSGNNINALNQHSAEIMQHRDATSRDGSANQADPTKRLTQYINQVTGTDIVSDAEFDAGFTITGRDAPGLEVLGSIQFLLDKDRTTGAVGDGAQVISLGANDVDNADGDNDHATGTDVTANYDWVTGDWSLAFAPGSGALLQATHNTYGSGVHQLVVDTDGNGSRTGSGASAEASRLFLVASGTASSSHTGLVSQNFSVQDKLTNDVFVYYFGDPDGAGIGLWTELDNGDSASNQGLVTTNRDSNGSDFDYYNTSTANTNAATTPVTPSNTALHLVTNIGAQTWEFHMARIINPPTWSTANAQATDHGLWGSNSSRLASLAESIALYAANFGGDGSSTLTPNTVGAVQPMSNAGNTNGYAVVEDNRPSLWEYDMWTAAPTPSGHALLGLRYGNVFDYPDAFSIGHVSAVL